MQTTLPALDRTPRTPPPTEVLLQDLPAEFRTHLANAQKYINENKELVDSELVLDVLDETGGSPMYRIGMMVPACAVEVLSENNPWHQPINEEADISDLAREDQAERLLPDDLNI